MPKKIAECTKAHLISVPLPNHGATYTVISHQSVMDYVYTELATAGFSVRAMYMDSLDVSPWFYKQSFGHIFYLVKLF